MRRPTAPWGRWPAATALLLAGISSALISSVSAQTSLPPSAQAAVQGVDSYGQLEDPVLQARFETITKQLRCLVCQNESIADSNVELASNLRRQVREMLIAGAGDDAIFKFMTDRYGEFVRFNPPLESKTLLIWGAPFIALLLGAAVVFRVVRHRSRLPLDD
jgi:cytochrome c-type biogenesis protein CcmH